MTDEPVAMKMNLWGRDDDLVALGCVGPDDLNTRDWVEGDTITLTVVGVERRAWTGVQVR
jgi:hypothetical protein